MAAGVKNSRPMLWPLYFALLISFYLFSLETAPAGAEDDGNGITVASIGAIVDENTRIGKEQTIAMKIQLLSWLKRRRGSNRRHGEMARSSVSSSSWKPTSTASSLSCSCTKQAAMDASTVAIVNTNGYQSQPTAILQDVGSEIEYRLALPPVASMPNPKEIVLDELVKLLSTQEAKSTGLIGRDTAWIVTDSISSLFDSVNSTVKSSMGGVLGVKTHYSETGREFNDFYFQFWEEYRAEFPQELYPQPSIHAARAYDAVTAITNAMEQLGNYNVVSSRELLQGILSSNFQGLSGEISFERGELFD
ncbi:hypothetical protein Nepgr_032202 [Nepenthes gracilis]|uniref:Receptor ligand binding region domain-containing protein n=1 Tax=Nepenthes gracilis TaxID=150966 RepID=A0AAD3Y7P8_NEPGR|nr:hypothetical protein Nepgr_032202 [Nepenthes gracilis]